MSNINVVQPAKRDLSVQRVLHGRCEKANDTDASGIYQAVFISDVA